MKKYTGLASIIFVMLIWGSTIVVTKILVTSIPPLFFAFIRFLIASLCLLPAFIFSKTANTGHLKPADYVYLILMGLLGVTLFYIAFNISLMHTSASTGAMIQGFLPAAIAVMGVIFLREKLNRIQVAGISLSTAGVLAVGFLAGDQNGDSVKGSLLMISAMMCWAGYTIISRKLGHISSLASTCLSGFAGTVLLLPAGLIDLYNHGPVELSAHQWIALVYLGAVASALCYFLYNKALETLPAAQVGNFLNLEPVVGVITAVIFLHEQLSILHVAGSVCVLTGIVMSSIKKGGHLT